MSPPPCFLFTSRLLSHLRPLIFCTSHYSLHSHHASLSRPRGGRVPGLRSLLVKGGLCRRLSQLLKPISGLRYRKICPFTLRHAAALWHKCDGRRDGPEFHHLSRRDTSQSGTIEDLSGTPKGTPLWLPEVNDQLQSNYSTLEPLITIAAVSESLKPPLDPL